MAEPSRVEFARRRRALMRLIGRDGIAIVPSAPVRQRNSDVEYNYRQGSDFYYLTGFNEPEAVAVLIPGREAAEYVLFVRDRNREREIWDGKRAGPEGAVEQYDANDAFPIADIDEILPGLLENRERVFYTMGLNQEFDQRVIGWVSTLRAQARSGLHPPQEFVALDHALHDMRLFKSRGEIGLMRRAGQIAAGAHVRGMRFCRPGRMEYEVMAELLHEFNRHGADISYHPIVGGGAMWAVTTLLVKATALIKAPAEKGLGYQVALSIPILGFAAWISGERITHVPGLLSLSLLAYQAIWVVGLTFLLWFVLVKTYSASKLSAFTFITPLFGVVASYFILHDALTLAFGAAALLVIAGLYLVNRPEASESNIVPDPNVPA